MVFFLVGNNYPLLLLIDRWRGHDTASVVQVTKAGPE